MDRINGLENGLEKADQDKIRLQQTVDNVSVEKGVLESELAEMV